MPPLGQRRQPSATGRDTTLSCLNGALHLPTCMAVPESRDSRAPSLESRDEGTHAPRGQRRPCVSDVRGLVCLPSGSATTAVSDGTGDKPRTPPWSRATGSVWTTRTGQRRYRDVPPKDLIFERLPGQRRGEPRALLTSRVARSRLALNPLRQWRARRCRLRDRPSSPETSSTAGRVWYALVRE